MGSRDSSRLVGSKDSSHLVGSENVTYRSYCPGLDGRGDHLRENMRERRPTEHRTHE